MTPPEDAGEVFADEAGRYRLDSRIATGGMGEVWRATDTVLGRPVAVKLLKSEYADDAAFRSRFETEARHAGSLQHPGIASVFDFGEAPATDGSGAHRPFLVMELVDGQPLSALLRPDEPMDPDVVRDLIGQAADAIGAAHAAGIVHRDLKPANLLVTPDRRVKITDFGIARAAEGMALTQTGQVMGTPQYLSPEQARGTTATPASDVYALGVVAFECLAGRRPFVADSPVATALAHLREPVPPLPPEIPSDLAAVVRKAMAKEPPERYPDGAALAAALRDPATAATAIVPPPVGLGDGDEAADSTQVLGGAAAAGAAGAAAGAGAAAADTGRTAGPTTGAGGPPPGGRSRRWLVLGALAVLIVLVAGFLVFANMGDETTPTENPTKKPGQERSRSTEPTDSGGTGGTTSEPSGPSSQPTRSESPSETQSPSQSETQSASPTETSSGTPTEPSGDTTPTTADTTPTTSSDTQTGATQTDTGSPGPVTGTGPTAADTKAGSDTDTAPRSVPSDSRKATR